MMTARHILVAEDEAHTRLSLNILLKRAGYRVTSVSDGAKALELVMKSAEGGPDFIDLLMTDIQMPVMGGLELLRAMKAKGCKTPALVFTGFGDKATLIELLREGCEDYIDKPFTEEALLERIREVLRKDDLKRRENEDADVKLQETKRKLERYRNAFSETCDSIENAITAYKRIVGTPVVSAQVKVALKSLPMDRIGGDYCVLRDCPWGCDMLFADVAGHDMGASYHTVLLKSFFDVNCQLGNSGEEFMRLLNKELYKDGANERMVCAIFGRLNLQELWMETVSASHPYVIRLGQGGGGEAPFGRPETGGRCGAPLGMFEHPNLEVRRFKISPGDRIFLYSDGVPDSLKFDVETKKVLKLGEGGLRAILKRHMQEPLDKTVENVWTEVMDYCGSKASDDMMLFGVEIPGAVEAAK